MSLVWGRSASPTAPFAGLTLGTADRGCGRRRHMRWVPLEAYYQPTCRPDAGGPSKSPGPPLIVPGAAAL